jgi:basic membrane lipoprotein Med (substrate-binding protein (PBP1-ABC) superfamily)
MIEWWAQTRRFARRRRWLLVAAAGLVIALGVVWAVWPSERVLPARRYLDFTACLLTDERGITGRESAPVWAGMQDASLATRAKVQYASVAGPQTVDNAVPFLSGLAQSRCDLVFAVGAVPVGAVGAVAPRFPGSRFVVVGGAVTGANVSTVDVTTAEATRAAVHRRIVTAVG